MAKEAVNIKSNGLRNELKEIRKSIDKLTNAIIAQTHKPDERNYYQAFILLTMGGCGVQIRHASAAQTKTMNTEV